MLDIMRPRDHRARSLDMLVKQQNLAEAKAKAEADAETRRRSSDLRNLFQQYGPAAMQGDAPALAEISKYDPKAAQELQGGALDNRKGERELKDKQVAAAQAEVDDIINAIATVDYLPEDQRSMGYRLAVRELKDRGHDISSLPSEYDAAFVAQKKIEAMTFSDRLAEAREKREAARQPERSMRPPRAIYDPSSPTGQRLVSEEDAIGQPTGNLPGADPAVRSQQSDVFRKPDGTTVKAEFIPGRGFGERKNGEWTPLPEGSEPTTPSAGGTLTPQQFLVLREKFTQEQQALQRLNRYGESVGGINVGLQNWADAVGAKIKTAFGDKTLSQAEFSRLSAQGQQQALLGLFRVDIVGPGVMTEYDAQRISDALGGNVNALLNPTIVQGLLTNLYSDKMQRLKLYEGEIARNAPTFNVDPMRVTAPPEFGGVGAPMPEASPAPGAAGDVPPGAEEIWQYLTPEEQKQWPR